jgi:ABC-type glycerol-3-phosphate transport system substrate-binding protein
MKKLVLGLGVVLVLVLAGCSAASTPSAAAKKFYEAVEKNDTKMMAEYATPETVSVIAMFGQKVSGMMAAYGKIDSVSEVIDGDTAVVTVKFSNGETSDLDMIKVDGKWKVNIDMGNK